MDTPSEGLGTRVCACMHVFLRSKDVLTTKDLVFLACLQTPEAYEQEYRTRLQEDRYQELNLTEFILAGSEYDAMWAMALGLHEASERVRLNDSSGCGHLPGELVPLEQFDYLNEKMGCVFRESFQQVTFRGITVRF